MLVRSARVRGSGLALALCAASPAVAAIDLAGSSNATFMWQAASGPVSGYVIYQLCEENGATQTSLVSTNQVTLSPQTCSAFSVQVAAYGAEGLAQTGPLSEISELVRFVSGEPVQAPAPTPAPEDDGAAALAPPTTPSDFNSDGRADVLLHHVEDGALQLWSLRETRLLPWTSLPAFPPAAQVVGTGDYDADASPDLLGLDRGQVFVWLMRDATPVDGHPLGEPLGAGGSVEGSGDYDGDGVSDVLIRRPAQGYIQVWSMDGGEISAIDTLAADPGEAWRIIGSGDHDGDGRSDVLWQYAPDGQLVLWRLLGRGSFEAQHLAAPLGAGWQGVGVVDFDGDGRDDVLWRKLETGQLAISRFDADGLAETRSLTKATPVPSREIVGTGDFDGDGQSDLLVRFVGQTGLHLWRMQATAVISRTRITRLGAGWTPANVGKESPSTRRWIP